MDDEEEGFDNGFLGLPSEKERAAMSVVKLAQLLSSVQQDSVQHIVLSHELAVKIAERQSRFTHRTSMMVAAVAAIVSVSSAVIGALANAAFHSANAHQVAHGDAACERSTAGAQADGQRQKDHVGMPSGDPVQPAPLIVPPLQQAKPQGGGSKASDKQ